MNKSELLLLPNDVSWKDDFLPERERIELSIPDSSVIIEHIGSTAIPNIHAKPILDISILCGNNGLNAVADALRKLGYEYRGGFDDERGHFYAVLDKDNMRYC